MSLAALAAFAIVLTVAGAAWASSAIGIYRNPMETVSQRAQMLKLSGANCTRGGGTVALRVSVGKRTEECSYSTPVVGRDLEIWTTARLLSGTPRAIRKRVYLAANLRSGGGGRYQLAMFPTRRKIQLRKVLPNGSIRYLKVVKGLKRIRNKINNANEVRLRAFNVTSGPNKGGCRLVVYLNGRKTVAVTDPKGGELDGRFSGFSVGSRKSARGAVASFDDVVVRVPTPF
ncbi:MAG: hypothetical protein U0R52_08250 [Solirubrobacterales bacterium]